MGMSGVIAMNVGAVVFFHMVDPETRKKAAEQEAFGMVEDAALEQISANARSLAAELAPTLAADWMEQTRAKYTARLKQKQLPSGEEASPFVTVSDNHKEPQEVINQ